MASSENGVAADWKPCS